MIFKNIEYYIYWIKAFLFLHKHGFYDIHVHARDMKQKIKYTIAKWKWLAWFYGVRFGAFMPNTDPTITDEATLKQYIEIAEKSGFKKIKYKIWFGLTADLEQVKKFVQLYNDERYGDVIIGVKIYAGPSTGDLAILDKSQLRNVLEALKNCGYTGHIAFHCEEKSLFCPEKYNPERPETWNLARPEESEVFSVNQIISLVREANFHGHIHICHVSSHTSVLAINEAKRQGMRISCGTTIHHLVFDIEQMAKMSIKKALDKKCNPPIGTMSTRRLLLRDAATRSIDIIESDFAPHTEEDKKNGASGVSNYQYLPNLVIELWRADASDERIIELINKNPCKIFKIET